MFSWIPLSYYALTGLINFITAIILSFLVIHTNRQAKSNKLFSAFALSVAAWSIFYFLWLITPNNKELAVFYLRTCMIFVFFMPALFFDFVVVFFKFNVAKKYVNLNYILAVIFSLTVYTPLYAHTPSAVYTIPYWLHPGWFFHFIIAHFGVVIILSCYLVRKALAASSGHYRVQLLYVYIGTLIGFAGGSTNYFSWYRISFPPIFNSLVAVYMILIAYAIIKHRLMDIRVVVSRAAIFIVVYFLVLGLPFWLAYKLLGGWGVWVVPFAFVTALAVIGPLAYSFFTHKAEDVILRKEKKRVNQMLDSSEEVAKMREGRKDVYQAVKALLYKALEPSFIVLYNFSAQSRLFYEHDISDKGMHYFAATIPDTAPLIKELKKNKTVGEVFLELVEGYTEQVPHDTMAVPFFVKDQLYAFAVVGPKEDGSAYSDLEFKAFKSLASDISLALENSIFREEQAITEQIRRQRSLDNFSSSMAHEINNPLTSVKLGIINLVDIIENDYKGELTDKAKAYLIPQMNDCLDTLDRVTKMIVTLKEFSGKTSEKQIIKIDEVVDMFSTMFNPILKHTIAKDKIGGIEFNVDIQPNIYVLGNKTQLAQVLMNLAVNALHAVTHSATDKKMTLAVYANTPDSFIIALQDNGYGIEKDKLEDIFLDYVTTKGSVEGTGMGLSLVRKIVETHGGRVWAESSGKGKGAGFFVELPLVKAAVTT